MKKLIAVSAVAALAATALSAEITFGSWLRVLSAPVANNGDDTVTAAGNSWGWGARSARLDINGKSEDDKAGFTMGIRNDAFDMDKPTCGDAGFIWVKPVDVVKVSYGKYDNNTLRGDLCFGSWDWLRPASSWIAGDEGLLMSGNGGTGLLAEITPVENLYIQALLPITKETKAEKTYKNIQAGLAYTVPGTAKIKAQYIGAGDVDDEANSNCALEAEVDLLAVENLFLGVGFRYDVKKDGDENADAAILKAVASDKDPLAALSQKMKVALGASFQINEQLKLSASGALFTYYSDKEKIDPRFQAGAGVDYDLGDGLAVNADFRYLSPAKADGEKADHTDHIGFSAGVAKNVSSNGRIGVAFVGQTNGGYLGAADDAGYVIKGVKEDKLIWAIPVSIQVGF